MTREDGLNDPQSGYLQETRIVRDGAGAILSHDVTGSRRFGVGQKAVLREVYHATLGLQSNGELGLIYDSASYWTDDDHPRRNGRPRLVWGESRPWSYQVWDDEGREILRLDQYDGSDAPTQLAEFAAPSELADLTAFPAISAIATVSDYTALPGTPDDGDDIDSVRTEFRYLVRNGTTTLIGRTWRIYTHGTDSNGRTNVTVQTIRAGSQTAALDDPGNAVSTETRFDADAPGIPLLLRGRPVTSTDEDGVTTTYDYALGNYDPATHAFTPNASGTALRTIVSRSTAAAPNGISGKSTQTLTIEDAAHGTTLYSATLLVGTGGSSGPAISWQANAYDDKNRLRSTLYSDGSSTTNAYSCCRLLWTQDRNGFKTLRSAETGKDHLYYAMEEVSLAELPGGGNGHRITQHFMDALGRETNTVVTAVFEPGSAKVPDCVTTGPRTSETTSYPDGTSDYSIHTDPRGVRTVTANRSFADREESVALTFHPTNLAVHVLASTNITYRNGRSISIQSWDGGWTRETSLTDYNPDGTRRSTTLSESSDCGTVTNSIALSDFLGRVVATITPLGIVSNFYDGVTSRLIRSEATGQAVTLYTYDALGESAATIQSGIATASETSYESIDGEVWQVAIRSSSSDGITNAVSTSRRQMTGLSNSLRSRSVSIDANGLMTTEESAFDPEMRELTSTYVTDAATPTVVVSKFGRAIRRRTLVEAVFNDFDPLGRIYRFEARDPVTDDLLYDRLSDFDETGNEVHHEACYGGLTVTGSATFDAFNREATRTDAMGNAVTNAYDALGRPVGTSGATYPILCGYDALGRMSALSTTRDGTAWDTTLWRYDFATGLATNKVYADNSVIAYTYTDDGKPLRTTWARSAWREQIYNPDGLLAATSYSDATPAATHVYDAFQRLAAASNAVAAYVYANSALGTATNETAMVGSEVHTLMRHLDDRHRLASLSVGDAQAHFGYDVENRLATVSNAVFTVAYAYTIDGWDAGHAVTLTNGTTLSRIVARDACRRQLVTAITNSVNGVALNSLAYDHDLLNRVVARNADRFEYNARGEVMAASIQSNAYIYAYDNIGSHATSTVNSTTTTYTANALNQYTAILCPPAPLREPSHDLDGNLLTNGVWSYEYDAENRLVAAYSNSLCVVSNAYDHMGRLVLKVSHGGTETRRFVYDGWNLVQETIQNQQSTITNHYVWGKDLSGTMQGAGGVGGLLAVTLNDSWYFPLTDANGNITAYIDEQGSVVAEYAHDAFGLTISQSGTMDDAFPHRFSTKYYDSETGLYYYGYRFYDPVLHRWLNRDPVDENGGENLYAFCKNSPYNLFDILGREPDKTDGDPNAEPDSKYVRVPVQFRVWSFTRRDLDLSRNLNGGAMWTITLTHPSILAAWHPG